MGETELEERKGERRKVKEFEGRLVEIKEEKS